MKRVLVWAAVSSDEQAIDGKASIPDQLARQRERAARNGWQVIDEIVIEGFSRRFYTFAEFADAAAAAGHSDARRMFHHWQNRTFDILSCRDLSRLGREQSILNEVIARTIDAGAMVVPLDDAALDATNYRMISAISGIGASQHIDNLIKYREMGMTTNAAAGRKTGSKPPRFFEEVRDDKGKPLYIKPDRHYQRLFDDFYTVFVDQRIPYDWIGDELYTQFAHVDSTTGKPYAKHVFISLLYSPFTWGHSVYGVRRLANYYGNRYKFWVTGEGDIPPEIKFFRNIVEPIYQSPQYDRMLSEFRHRHHYMRGRQTPRTRYMYSGLLVCAICGGQFAISHKVSHGKDYDYYRCSQRPYTGCANYRHIKQEHVTEWLIPRLEHIAAGLGDLTPAPLPSATLTTSERIASIQADIDHLTAEINNWITMIGSQRLEAARVFQQRIDSNAEQIERLRVQLLNLTAENTAALQQASDHAAAVSELRTLPTIADLFANPPPQVNQFLFRLFGDFRLQIADGEIVGMTRGS